MYTAAKYTIILTFLFFSLANKPSFAEDTPPPQAAVVTPQLIINNITVVDPEGKKPNANANILIQDRMFELVTLDVLEHTDKDLVIDAGGGFLLGTLEVNKAPSFLILDINPFDNFGALLNTKEHILIAVHQGIAIVNNIKPQQAPITTEATTQNSPQHAENHSKISSSSNGSTTSSNSNSKKVASTKNKDSAWLAYTPPPFVLSTGLKKSDWNVFNNQYFSTILAGALALDRQKWTSQNDISKQQVGDLTNYDGGEIRALRFGLAGQIKFDKPWVYTIAGATNSFDKGYNVNDTDEVTMFDWRLDIPTFYNTTLSIGKQKEPISMERLSVMVFLPGQERSVVSDVILPSRNVGAVLSGISSKQRVTWAGGVFNDWLDDDGSIGENTTQFVGRTTWLPYLSLDETQLLHLGFGFRYSNAKEDILYAGEPEFNKSPRFIESDLFDADGISTYNLEAAWRYGPYAVMSEYVLNNVDAPQLGNPSLSGYHVSAAWALTGEMRDYNKRSGTFNTIPVARSVEQGGIGAWEVTTRWSVFDGNDKGISAGKTSILSAGAYWWLTPKFNLSLNYRWISLDGCGSLADDCNLHGRSEGFNTRLLLLL